MAAIPSTMMDKSHCNAFFFTESSSELASIERSAGRVDIRVGLLPTLPRQGKALQAAQSVPSFQSEFNITTQDQLNRILDIVSIKIMQTMGQRASGAMRVPGKRIS